MTSTKKNIDYAGYVLAPHADYAYKATCSRGHSVHPEPMASLRLRMKMHGMECHEKWRVE